MSRYILWFRYERKRDGIISSWIQLPCETKDEIENFVKSFNALSVYCVAPSIRFQGEEVPCDPPPDLKRYSGHRDRCSECFELIGAQPAFHIVDELQQLWWVHRGCVDTGDAGDFE